MRSTAQIGGHPIHPILIAFPIAFGVGAPVADLLGVVADWPSVWTTGAYLAAGAIVTGLVAAVPGIIDYLYTVPPNSSAKKRATWHMVVNVLALGLIGAGWAFRDPATLRPETTAILLEFAGIGVMGVGGWLGGTLVYRNQIGVDHRYAEAGKWQEQEITETRGTADVGAVNDLKIGQMKLLHVNGRRIVLARTEDGHVACDDRCPHKGGSLAGGILACSTITCPWHGSQFNAATGEVVSGPAEQRIGTYRVEEIDGRVRLTLPVE